jgi:uncharacterized OB-fold protein
VSRAPLPQPTPLTQGFWDAAREGRLVAQRCGACRAWRHYPQLRCPECHSPEWSWEELSGRGTVHSFSVVYQAFHPDWSERVPYAVATIELEEGIRMVTDMDDVDDVAIGLPVEVFFDAVDDRITLPRWRRRS